MSKVDNYKDPYCINRLNPVKPLINGIIEFYTHELKEPPMFCGPNLSLEIKVVSCRQAG